MLNSKPGRPARVSLDDVLITAELYRRPARPADPEAENRALHAIARQMGGQPEMPLKNLAGIALDLCRADTAGISLLETAADGGEVFRWAALAGIGETRHSHVVPADLSPCGVCLQRRAPQLYACPARYFTCLRGIEPAIVESLVVPLSMGGRLRGTFWMLTHDAQRHFDREDLRVMTSLADFIAAASRISEMADENARLGRRARDEIAERKRSEAELRDNESRLRAAFEQAAVGMVEAGQDGRLRQVNDEYCRITGYSRKELIGRSVWELTYAEDVAENRRQFDMTVTAGQPSHTLEKRYVRKDGTLVWVRVTANLVRSETGEATCVIGVIEDVTEHKRAEQALRRSEEFSRQVVESTRDCIKVLDLEGRLLSMSESGQCALEIDDPHSFLNRPWIEFWQRGQHEAVAAAVRAAAAGGTGRFQGYLPTVRTQQPRWWDVMVTPMLDDAGRPTRLLAVSRDITAQIAKERTLQFLVDMGRATQPLTDPDEIMQTCARLLGEYLKVNRCAYAEVEQDADHFVVTGDYTRDTFSIRGHFAMSAFGTRALRLMRRNKVFVVGDIEAEAPADMDLTAYRQTDIRAVVCVPLHKHGRLAAGMAVHQKTPRRWTTEEIDLVQLVANRCWESIERARVEKGLRQSEERLRLALDAAQMGVWGVDLTSGRVTLDARVRNIYGLDPDAEITDTDSIVERVHADDLDAFRSVIRTACNRHSDGRYTFEYRVPPRGQAERWVLASGRVFFDDEGARRRPVRIIGTALDITGRKRLERQLRHSAFHDTLTNLPNRALFMGRLGNTIDRARTQGKNYALLMLDIDNFKLINDSFGHLAGDQLLVEFARFMRRRLRPQDTLARLGGDEFCVLIDGVESRQEVLHLVECIQEGLKTRPFYVRGQQLHAGISVGISFDDQDHREADAVVQDADIALYEAKRRGKGGHVIFNGWMRQRSQRHLSLQRALRRAVAHDEITAHYQPIVDLAGKVVGCEALARWSHPRYGQIGPARFIPLAEEAGLILPLGELVLETACRELAGWLHQRHASGDFYVAVNLSVQQLAQDDLVDQVDGLLARHGLASRNLRLEVTESSIIMNGEHAARVIGKLQARGVRVCLDDFGVGYSSLSYLQHLPVSVLKLDRSFVKNLPRRPVTKAIVRTILDLAGNLGLEAVAEGVERDAHREVLKAMGFTRAQGFLFHRPMPGQAMAAALAAAKH